MKKLGLLLMLALAVTGAKADDFGLWTNVGAEQNLGVKGLSADVNLGFRSSNSVRSVDRWSAGFGLGYKICPWLKVGANYVFMYNYSPSERKEKYKENGKWEGYNITDAYWRVKNRFSFDLKTGYDIGRFSFSLRERYQLTGYNSVTTTKTKYRFNQLVHADGREEWIPRNDSPEGETDFKERKSKEYLRSKLEVSYDINNCRITPSVSVELQNNLRKALKLDEVRYVAGFDWKINKKTYIGASYNIYKGSDDDDGDIQALEISLKLKNIFWKAKK